jgi:hypothetical protein
VLDPLAEEHVLVADAEGGALLGGVGADGEQLVAELVGDTLVGIADVEPGVLVWDVVEAVVSLAVFGVEDALDDADVGEARRCRR